MAEAWLRPHAPGREAALAAALAAIGAPCWLPARRRRRSAPAWMHRGTPCRGTWRSCSRRRRGRPTSCRCWPRRRCSPPCPSIPTSGSARRRPSSGALRFHMVSAQQEMERRFDPPALAARLLAEAEKAPEHTTAASGAFNAQGGDVKAIQAVGLAHLPSSQACPPGLNSGAAAVTTARSDGAGWPANARDRSAPARSRPMIACSARPRHTQRPAHMGRAGPWKRPRAGHEMRSRRSRHRAMPQAPALAKAAPDRHTRAGGNPPAGGVTACARPPHARSASPAAALPAGLPRRCRAAAARLAADGAAGRGAGRHGRRARLRRAGGGRVGRPVGILTEQDIARRVAFRLPPDAPLSAAMTAPVIACAADDGLWRAVALMRAHRLRHLPVLGADGRCAGMLHRAETLAAASGRLLGAPRRAGRRRRRGEARPRRAWPPRCWPRACRRPRSVGAGQRHQRSTCIVASLAARWRRRTTPPPVPFTLLVMGSLGPRREPAAPGPGQRLHPGRLPRCRARPRGCLVPPRGGALQPRARRGGLHALHRAG